MVQEGEQQSGVGEKRCSRCGEVKSRHDFYVVGSGRLHSRCRPCSNAASRESYRRNKAATLEAARQRRLRNPELARAQDRANYYKNRAHLRRRYGLTSEQYEEMKQSQNGVCAICLRLCSVKPSLSVDHDHDSGRVRGLLCHKCNFGIGAFDDSPERMIVAAQYVKRDPRANN